MSNKDIKNSNLVDECNNIDKSKDNISIFKLSSLKSKEIILTDLNNFNLDFSKEKSKLKYIINIQESSNKNDNKLICEKETNHINNYFLNSIYQGLPSTKNIWKQYFNMNEFDSSFAKYCGINKEEFIEIFINNQNFLFLNEFGDINLSSKIVNFLNGVLPFMFENNKKYLNKKKSKIFITKKKVKKIIKNIKNIIINNNNLINNLRKENYHNNISSSTKDYERTNNQTSQNNKENINNNSLIDIQNNNDDSQNSIDKDIYNDHSISSNKDDSLEEKILYFINSNYN